MADVHDRLLRNRPAQRHTGLVHGDYRLGNVMVRPAGRIAAVLDWELAVDRRCAVRSRLPGQQLGVAAGVSGHRLDAGAADAGGRVSATRRRSIERYAARTGFDVSCLDYYRAFMHWRMAVIAEGIKRRYESGSMAGAPGDDARAEVDFDHLERRVGVLAALADRHLQAAGG